MRHRGHSTKTSRRRRTLRGRQGMTLVEILIVVTLLALVAAGVVYSVGALTRTSLRGSCMRVAAAARYGFNRAVTKGTTVRVVLDLDSNQISIDEAHGPVTLARADDPRAGDNEEEDNTAVDPWAAARERLEETFQPTFGASPFGPIRGPNGDVLARYRPQPVGRGVQILQLITPHEPAPRERGKGAIFFFPQGHSEHAIVQLSDGGDTVYTVEIHPLTGRGTVHSFAYTPEQIIDGEHNEVEDPG